MALLAVGCMVVAAHSSSVRVGSPPPGVALLPPPAGWSTWNTFACDINATLVRQGADHLASSGMLGAGYRYILIDGGTVLN
jgi:alpha-galactosidase